MAGVVIEIPMADSSVVLALCSLLLYGMTQVIAKAAVGSSNATSMVAINFLVSVPIYVFIFLCAIFLWGEYVDHIEYVVYGFIGASTARAGYYIYLEALEKGAVSMVGSITAAFPAITATLAVTMLGEDIKAINVVGISIVIVSMVALSFTHSRSTSGTSFSRSSLILSLGTLMLWGFGGIFIKMALNGLPLIGYLGLYVFVVPPIAFAYLRHKGATRGVLIPKWTVPVIGAIVVAELWQLGYFAETSAVSQGAASIVFPLISAYPVVTILGAWIFIKEKLSRLDWTILGMVLLGILLISVP
jgi:transporter family protein